MSPAPRTLMDKAAAGAPAMDLARTRVEEAPGTARGACRSPAPTSADIQAPPRDQASVPDDSSSIQPTPARFRSTRARPNDASGARRIRDSYRLWPANRAAGSRSRSVTRPRTTAGWQAPPGGAVSGAQAAAGRSRRGCDQSFRCDRGRAGAPGSQAHAGCCSGGWPSSVRWRLPARSARTAARVRRRGEQQS
jgi:hypothetical protein